MSCVEQKEWKTPVFPYRVSECPFEKRNGASPLGHTHGSLCNHRNVRNNGNHDMHVHRPQQRKALLQCLILTNVMMIVEFAAGWFTGSLMLVSDAIHMTSHAAALGISWLALTLAHRPTSKRFPFGLYRIEILAALMNGIALAGFALWIVVEAIGRVLSPVEIPAVELTAAAIIGLLVNLSTAFILHRSGIEDLNTRSAFLHMLADTFSSVAIVLGGILILLTDLYIIDSILSLVIALVVVKWSLGLLRESVTVLLEAKPDHVDLTEIEQRLQRAFPEIRDVHSVHVWEITSQFVCLSAHVAVADMALSTCDALRVRIHDFVSQHFQIQHVVLQLECDSPANEARQERAGVHT
jgi:cobalt-zinc-cadmium efflux system protein